jgi:putative RNA 2'-phosphotransferase
MAGDEAKRLSKFLSLILRHDPGHIGLELDGGGWAEVREIIARAGFPVTPEAIADVVRSSDKQRFSLSPDGTRIRANQGHSFPVDLGLTPVVPPEVLFHGTGEGSVAAILAEGLKPMARQHVHLSKDRETAVKVGQRHGRPVVLTVAAERLAAAGQVFYLSLNGVWLTGPVAPEVLRRDG